MFAAASASVFLACGGQPAPQSRATEAAPELFSERAAETGLRFEHFTGATGEYFMPEIMGAGVGLLDYDADGDLDVFLPQGALLDSEKTIEDALFPPPKTGWPGGQLYRNEIVPSGKLRFVNATNESGIRQTGYGMGVAVGDYDNDGNPDLYLTSFGPNALYRNDGDGTFTDVTTPSLADDRWSTSAAFLDYDNDGDLDLFFANYIDFRVGNSKQCFDRTGARDYCTPNAYKAVPDRLLRNDGGRFTDVSDQAGLGAAFGNGLGVVCADFDGDGLTDIYVANDGVANQLWRNGGDGSFQNDALMSGVALNADGLPEAGMGVTAGDFDSDGDEDLFMTHLALETNTLYVNDGRGVFRDETNRYGLGSVSAPFTGFGSRWFDFDNDGRLDLFVAAGGVTIMEQQRGSPYPFRQTNQLFHAQQARFEEVSGRAGEYFSVAEVSRGAAFGDVDNDGDIDIVVSNNAGPVRLLLNNHNGMDWVRVRLRGVEDNRDALGARVALLTADGPSLWRRVHTDGSYLSASEKTVQFGIPEGAEVQAVGVEWLNGARERFEVTLGRTTEVRQGAGKPWR